MRTLIISPEYEQLILEVRALEKTAAEFARYIKQLKEKTIEIKEYESNWLRIEIQVFMDD